MAVAPYLLRRIAAELGFPIEPIPTKPVASRDLALRFLVSKLADRQLLPIEAVYSVVDQIKKREALESTGVGGGLAMPHTIHWAVQGLVGICGWSDTGIPWESLDGKEVHCVCLMLTSADRPGDHLRALETVSRLFKS